MQRDNSKSCCYILVTPFYLHVHMFIDKVRHQLAITFKALICFLLPFFSLQYVVFTWMVSYLAIVNRIITFCHPLTQTNQSMYSKTEHVETAETKIGRGVARKCFPTSSCSVSKRNRCL